MNPAAVEQAEARLQKCRLAIEIMGAAGDDALALIEQTWCDFVEAAATIYAKLEQGAKGTNKSESWFGRKKHDRKSDPLLQYIHQARNSEQHGIEKITAREERGLSITNDGTISFRYNAEGKKWDLVGVTGEHTWLQGKITLVTVYDRKHGLRFDPPTTHLSYAITDQSPLIVGKLALDYLDGIVKEARALMPRSAE